MIDLISFTLPEGTAPILENIYDNGTGTLRGNFKNFRIVESPDGVYCSGSLAKYLNGENVSTLSKNEVKESMEKLQKETGWNLENALLKKVEIGATFPVQNPSCEYLKSWGVVPRFTKAIYQKKWLETITYSIGELSFTAYDKKAESKIMPPIFKGHELLRMELRIKKKLQKRIGIFSPLELTDNGNYKRLVEEWQKFYFSIPKGTMPVIDISKDISPKHLDNILKIQGLQTLGDSYYGYISKLEDMGILGTVQAGRARKSARELQKNKIISEPDYLTQEIDSKVREIGLYL